VPESTISVDFNERDLEGNVLALAEDAPSTTSVGDRVVLTDSEGNTVRGEVVSLEPGLVSVRADWSTWRDGDSDEAGLWVARASGPVPLLKGFTATTVDFEISETRGDYIIIERLADEPFLDLLEDLRERARSGGASVAAKIE
jgi:hypothetical protein